MSTRLAGFPLAIVPFVTVLLMIVLGATGCRTARVDPAPDGLRLRALSHLASLDARHTEVRSLRARVRTQVEGASGEAFSRQVLLIDRPSRLRIEVLGLLGQRALALTTDGEAYEIYRAGVPGIEAGAVHPALLWEVAGVPLTPDAAVSTLLAAPRPPKGAAMPEIRWDGAKGNVDVGFADRSFAFDAAGRLREYRWHPDGHDWLVARYDAWQDDGVAAFPREIDLDFPANGAGASIAFDEVELNPDLAPTVFRLRPPEPLSSDAGGAGG